MPRNGSSVYSLPAGNPVVPGTVIATTWANTTLTDIATALTNSLSTDGSTAAVSLSGKTMTGGTFNFPAISGTLNLIGGNILFPAVQIPSANVNMLDDYEEGTFTPTVSFNTPGTLSVTYATQIGRYTKIGNSVAISIHLTTATFVPGTASGNFLISGLPFATIAATGVTAAGAIVGPPALDAGYTQMGIVTVAAGSASLVTQETGSTKVPLTMTATHWNGGSGGPIIEMTLTYFLA